MTELHAGRLLVATPLLDDPNFRRTVVLLCSHDAHGAFGLVLNRPLEAAVVDLAPEWRGFVTAPPVLFAGGPVDRAQAFALGWSARTRGESWWTPIGGGVGLLSLEGEPDALEDIEQVRLFAGYAGWGAGQLEGEVSEEAWFVVDAAPGDAFSARPARLWHEVLGRQRGELRLFAHFPPDPRLN
ncbi:MAG: YqgE/AlgH family protein [Dehalococcoidia bacterium]